MRIFPNMVHIAPGDELDVSLMLDFALHHNGPVSIRYPKAQATPIPRQASPVELGKAEVLHWGTDGTLIACGTLLIECLQVARQLESQGIDLGVINARFIKPLDQETLLRAVEESPFVITVEEGTLVGGFGSALLEAANDAALRTDHIRRLGIPDRYIMHAERHEQLQEVGLDAAGILHAVNAALERTGKLPRPSRTALSPVNLTVDV
ncbi:MAG: transketolase C-terminal domain-containing protein [Planctomycetales bacterium]